MMLSVEIIILVALLAAFFVLLVKKWGWAEWMQVHGDKYLSQLFSCDLCMSFWMAMIICMVLGCWYDDSIWLTIPMFSTPISRMLV